MSKKKLNNFKCIDGKVYITDSEDKNERLKQVKDIFTRTFGSKYKTKDKIVYESELNIMNLADLRNHATQVGIVPRDVSADKLKRQLLAEFIRCNTSF